MNTTTYRTRRAAGLCGLCGGPPRLDMATCQKCADARQAGLDGEKQRAYKRRYYEERPEWARQKRQRYYKKHRERILELDRRRREQKRERR